MSFLIWPTKVTEREALVFLCGIYYLAQYLAITGVR